VPRTIAALKSSDAHKRCCGKPGFGEVFNFFATKGKKPNISGSVPAIYFK
jgi:hypothetical protein